MLNEVLERQTSRRRVPLAPHELGQTRIEYVAVRAESLLVLRLQLLPGTFNSVRGHTGSRICEQH